MTGMDETPRFFCLCMSPAIDATVVLPSAPKGAGEIFKDVAEEENVGGKTINVARWLALRGESVACGGLLGEENDRPFVREFKRFNIADKFVRISGATRRNEMIVWPEGSVKLNRAAFPGLDGSSFASSLADDVFSALSAAAGSVIILSGSLPPAAPADFYARAVARFKAAGCTVVLDASGEAMRLALEAGPDLIKPNAEECEALVGFVPVAPDDFLRATELLRKKAAHVIISDGGSGAWFDGSFVPAPHVDVVDTTAAGDTLLAEYCWRVWGCRQAKDAARWAVAAGSAACTMPGGTPPCTELVERLKGDVG